jgi:hypothetical protein
VPVLFKAKYKLQILLSIWLFIFQQNLIISQDMLGITNSNYSGINGIMINPASIVNPKSCIDINIITVNSSIQNNYLYFRGEDYKISSLFNKKFMLEGNRKKDLNSDEEITYISDKYDKSNKYLFTNTNIQLPSLLVAYNKHAFGFSTASRSVASVNNMAYHAA